MEYVLPKYVQRLVFPRLGLSMFSADLHFFPGKLLYEINKVILAKTGYDHPIWTQLFSLFPSSLSVYTHVYSYMSIIHAK